VQFFARSADRAGRLDNAVAVRDAKHFAECKSKPGPDRYAERNTVGYANSVAFPDRDRDGGSAPFHRGVGSAKRHRERRVLGQHIVYHGISAKRFACG
jgi:hypothetical protein